jgi:lipopolysaccharide biosynthesis regulator YciM
MKFFLWVLTLIAATVIGVYFDHLNHQQITVRLSSESSTEVYPISLVLFSVAAGALAVVMLVGAREIRGYILNWQSSRRRKREEKVQNYYDDGVLASLSRRTAEAISLLQKVLALDPNHTRALVSLGNIFRKEKHYNEAIRLHRKARVLDEDNIEILFTLSKDLEDAKRYEEAIQALEEILKLDSTNPSALYRIRDIHLRTRKWLDAHGVQERLLKAGLPDRELRMETQIMTGLKYEVARMYMDRGDRDQARKYFKEAIKLDKNFLPARIGFAETLIREGKLRQAAESWEKSYVKTGNPIFLQRLEDLYLEMGEPGEMIRIYQDALVRHSMDPMLKLALGKLYYRLEMIDDAFDLLSTLEGLHDPSEDLRKMMVSLYIRKGNTEAAMLEIQDSLSGSRPVSLMFHCTACRYQTREWSGRCPQCERWNTIVTMPVINDSGQGPESKHEGSDISSFPGVKAPFEIV